MDCERPYYQNIDYHPTLYYAIFGADIRETSISRELHGVDGMPSGLNIFLLTKAENAEQFEGIIGGSIGNILSERFAELYGRIKETDICSVLAGTAEADGTLDYLRNAVGITEALVERGIAVLDLLTFTLYTPDEWKEKIFSPSADLIQHTVILVSDDQNGSKWLHTRGMIKFGRPDISLENVPPDEVTRASQVINQIIFYGIKGAFFHDPVRLHIPGYICDFKPDFVNDFNNDDFNNAYYKIQWEGIEFTDE